MLVKTEIIMNKIFKIISLYNMMAYAPSDHSQGKEGRRARSLIKSLGLFKLVLTSK